MPSVGVDAGATVLATYSAAHIAGTPAVVVGKMERPAVARSYLGPIYSARTGGPNNYNTAELRTGDLDKLLEQRSRGRRMSRRTTVSVAVSPASVAEDGASNLIYTFTRTGDTSGALTVNYSITGTATSGTDYTGASGTVSFAAGFPTATVTVDPTPDTTVEPDETVILTVIAGTGYTVGVPPPPQARSPMTTRV